MKKLIVILLLLTSCAVTGNVIREFSDSSEVYFCPYDNCRRAYFERLYNATTIDCAVYDTNLPEILTLFKNKKARLVVDHETSNLSLLMSIGAVVDSKFSVMHNKFCILDNQTVITGSMNPTFRDSSVNDNNLLIFHSKEMAKTYETEFEELYSGKFSVKGDKSKQNTFYLNEDTVNVYFCPEDWCINKLMDRINDAKESIYFMTFSFTHDKLGDLLLKKKKEGLIVKGLMEKSQSSQFSEFKKLNESGIDVLWESSGANMHHKVFIIDRKIVATGSMNPSANGDTSSDENLLIIENPSLASKFLDEFTRVYLRVLVTGKEKQK